MWTKTSGVALACAAWVAATPVEAAPLQDAPAAVPAVRTWEIIPQTTFPSRARRAGVTYGEVALNCRVRLDRRVDRCRIVTETPPGLGLGRAVLQSARGVRLTEAGAALAVDGRVTWTTTLNETP